MEDAKLIQWAEQSLLSGGYTINNPPENIQTTPWSKVKRFLTTQGYVYLKQMPAALSLEPEIIQILSDQFHVNVPTVLDINNDLNGFLMKECGVRLRDSLQSNFQVDLLSQGIKKYTDIQHATEAVINTFLSLGVPDWRLDKLPDIYQQLINDAPLLKEDGMSDDMFESLHNLFPTVASMCEELIQYKIADTLDHCDFHDGNILVENYTNYITIIDWGETVITHPFFSLISCINNAARRYHLNQTDIAYVALEQACFESWYQKTTENNLAKAIILAKRLQPIYRALGYHRLKLSTNANEFKKWDEGHGCITRPLKEFIKIAANDVACSG